MRVRDPEIGKSHAVFGDDWKRLETRNPIEILFEGVARISGRFRATHLLAFTLIRTASSCRMKPGGLPDLERTSSQSPVELTTLTFVPFGMLPTFREEADGSSKTDVLRTV